MSGISLGALRPYFKDPCGKPLRGGCIYTYDVNSVTPKASYADADLTVENTNPVVLDFSGEADIFLDGFYRIIVKDRHGVVIYDENDIGIGVPAGSVSDNTGLSQQQINDLAPTHADKSHSLQQAIYSAGEGDTIMLSGKVYQGGIAIDKKHLKGCGYKTELSVPDSSYAIKSLQTLPNWDKMRIGDLMVRGQTTNKTIGILFDPTDPVAGRRNIEYCTFEDLHIAIHKPTGNIGNTYKDINAHHCDYVIKAASVWDPLEMHSGNDTWRDFQIDTVAIWAFDYFDNTGGGAIHIKDGIIEYCEGGGIRIECSDSLPPFIPPRISNVWFEGVAKASSVIRDGVLEKPSDIKLINTTMCYIENCTLSSIELINSTAIISNSRVDRLRSVTLNNSNLIVENAYLHGSTSKKITINTVAKQSYPSAPGGDLTLRTSEPKGIVAQLSNALTQIGVTFKGNVGKAWEVYGTEQFYARSTNDGATLNLISGLIYRLPLVSTPENTWVVWGISARKEPSVTGDFKFNLDYNLGDIVFNEDGTWAHSFGVAKTPSNSGTRMCATFTPTSSGQIELKNYFVATFQSEAEAVSFLNSKFALNTYPESVSKSYNPATLINNEMRVTDIDFFGVSEGDNILASYNTSLKGTNLRAVVKTQNVVSIYHENKTGEDVVLDAGTLNIKLV